MNKKQEPISKESSVNDIVESLQHTLLKQKQRKRKVDELLFDEDDLEDEQYLLEAVKGSAPSSSLKSPTKSSSKRRDHHHHHAIDIDDNVFDVDPASASGFPFSSQVFQGFQRFQVGDLILLNIDVLQCCRAVVS